MTLSHRPGREGEPAPDGHVPAYLAMEYVTEAYHRGLREWCGEVLTPHEMAIVRIEADFRREVFVGQAEFETLLVRVGRSSITLSVLLRQSGRDAVAATVVLAHVAEGRASASPFSGAQRALLEASCTPDGA
jgi:acyl-CoA thioesterase FadM